MGAFFVFPAGRPLLCGLDPDQGSLSLFVLPWPTANERKRSPALSSLTAEQLRARAEVYRGLATAARTVDTPEMLLRLAKLYEEMAEKGKANGSGAQRVLPR